MPKYEVMNSSIVPARSLISEKRLDLGARIPLVEAYQRGWPLQWGLSLYESFLFSVAQSRSFGESWKSGIGDMTASFLDLLASIKHHDFDVDREVLAVKGQHLLTGAHRVSAQIVANGSVRVGELGAPAERWTFADLTATGMSDDLANSMVLSLAQYMDGIRLLAFFSGGAELPMHWSRQVTSLDLFRPVLTVPLSPVGRRRIFELMYGLNEWWRPQLSEKFDFERFGASESPHVHIAVLDEMKNGPIQEIKRRFRTSRPAGQTERVIHGSDSREDTLFALRTLLFSTGRHFLNSSPLGSESRLMAEMAGLRVDFGIPDTEPVCLGGSSSLEAYGIRPARDLDLMALPGGPLASSPSAVPPFGEAPIGPDLVVLDPRLHVSYGNLKFASLPVVGMLKLGRSEDKDRDDVRSMISEPSVTIPTFIDSGSYRKARRYRMRLRAKSVAQGLIDLLPEALGDVLVALYRRARH